MDARWDCALLRLPEPVAGTQAVLSIEVQPAAARPAALWGNPSGAVQSLAVRAEGVGGEVRYPLPQDLPGWSGGPITRPAADPEGGVACGLHRGWNSIDRLGRAVPLDAGALRAAMAAIRALDGDPT
jgi:hypothetical protein